MPGKSSLKAIVKNAIPFMDDSEKVSKLKNDLGKKTEGKTLIIGVALYNNSRKVVEHGKTQLIQIDL